MIILVRTFPTGDDHIVRVWDTETPDTIEQACKHMAWMLDRDRARCKLEPDWIPPAYMVTRK